MRLELGGAQPGHDFVHGGERIAEVAAEAGRADFQRTETLLQRFLEGAADGHGFAHALHGGGELVLGSGELFKGEAGNLDHAVVDGGLEAGHGLAGDVVGNFVERVADGELGGDFGDGEARGLGGESGGAGHAGVHFNDHELAVFGIQTELHVGTAGFHADFAHDGDGGVADLLIFHVGEGLHRSHGDGVAGVNAHGIEVFDGAHDHAVVLAVAHDFHFDFLPAEHGLFDEHFAGEGGVEAAGGDFFQIFLVVGHAAAGAAQREGGTDDEREGHFRGDAAHVFHVAGDFAAWHLDADVFHGGAEQLAAFSLFDDLGVGADEFDAAFLEHSHLFEGKGGVQAGLTAEGGQNGVGPFLADDGGHGFGFDGFNIGTVGQTGIGHDGRRVGIDKDDFVPFFLEGLHGLGTGIVEFTGLADDNGARTYDHNALKVCTLRHIPLLK